MNKYAILEGNMERLMSKVKRIQNKCRKYGCDFHFAEVGEEFREVKMSDGSVKTYRFVIVEAEGVAEINGWKFIASVEHTEKGNIISKACDVEVPARYYTTTPICEHCMSRRYRKDTFIIMNMETGEFKQVGRNCLADYTHGMSVEGVAAYASLFDEIIGAGEPIDGVGGGYTTYIDSMDILMYAAEVVRHFGYVKSDGFARGTSDRVVAYYGVDHGWYNRFGESDYRKQLQSEMEECHFNADSDEAKSLVEDALKWLDGQDESNNYMHNLKTVCALKWCAVRHVGLLSSLFPAFNKALEREAKKAKAAEDAKKSNWVGDIKGKVEVAVHDFKAVASWDTQWGVTRIYKFTDDSGNVFVWKTSNWVDDDKVEKIVGTVKDHTEFRGEKQTELTRCKCSYKAEEPKEYVGEAEKAIKETLDYFDSEEAM